MALTRQVEADGGPPKQFVKAIGALEDYIEPPGVSSVKHSYLSRIAGRSVEQVVGNVMWWASKIWWIQLSKSRDLAMAKAC